MAEPEKLDHYEILKKPDGTNEELGRGAMGVTYKALDTNLRRVVALKVISADYLNSDTARSRFLREARAAAQFKHEHVAAVFHLGCDQETYFYAMELIEGETLEQRIARCGPLDPVFALGLASQVARALIAAQQQGLIHRDIKPANLMLVEDGDGATQIKVIDFGLAKSVIKDVDAAESITMVGFVGTPLYASPEQLEEKELDIRSDIYSLGITLWYALTGQCPYTGSLASVLRQHMSKATPVEKLESAPMPVRQLLLHMLEKEPGQRPQSALALKIEIQACLVAMSAVNPDASRPGPNPALPVDAVRNEEAASPTDEQVFNGFSLLELLRARGPIPMRESLRLIEVFAPTLDRAIEKQTACLDLRVQALNIHFPPESEVIWPAALLRLPILEWPLFVFRIPQIQAPTENSAAGDAAETLVAGASLPSDETRVTDAVFSASDYVFFLGALTYELLAGRPPATGPNARYGLLAKLNEAGNRVLEKTISGKSAYLSARQFYEALKVSGAESVDAPLPAPPASRPRPESAAKAQAPAAQDVIARIIAPIIAPTSAAPVPPVTPLPPSIPPASPSFAPKRPGNGPLTASNDRLAAQSPATKGLPAVIWVGVGLLAVVAVSCVLLFSQRSSTKAGARVEPPSVPKAAPANTDMPREVASPAIEKDSQPQVKPTLVDVAKHEPERKPTKFGIADADRLPERPIEHIANRFKALHPQRPPQTDSPQPATEPIEQQRQTVGGILKEEDDETAPSTTDKPGLRPAKTDSSRTKDPRQK